MEQGEDAEGNESMTENLEDKAERADLKKDLKMSVPSTILGFVGGFATSYIFPQIVYIVAKDTKELFQKNFKKSPITTSAMYAAFCGTYLHQIQRFARDIIEEPSNPMNYIPVATNIIGGVAIQAYCEYKDMEESIRKKH